MGVETLISLLIMLLVLGAAFYIVKLAVAAFGLPPVIVKIAGVVFLLIAVVWLLQLVPGAVPRLDVD